MFPALYFKFVLIILFNKDKTMFNDVFAHRYIIRQKIRPLFFCGRIFK